MPKSLRWTSPLLLVLAVSGCCSILGAGTQGAFGVSPAVAFGEGDSDIGALLDVGCDCERFVGLMTGAGGGLFRGQGSNYLVANLFGRYAIATAGALQPELLLAGLLKRHSYGNDNYQPPSGSGGGSAFQDGSGSSTNFGASFGVGVRYSGLENAIPFASLERYQVGGGGFQVLRVGSRWTIGP